MSKRAGCKLVLDDAPATVLVFLPRAESRVSDPEFCSPLNESRRWEPCAGPTSRPRRASSIECLF